MGHAIYNHLYVCRNRRPEPSSNVRYPSVWIRDKTMTSLHELLATHCLHALTISTAGLRFATAHAVTASNEGNCR